MLYSNLGNTSSAKSLAKYVTQKGPSSTLAQQIAASLAANPLAAGSNGSLFSAQASAGLGDSSAPSNDTAIQQSIIPDPAVYQGETAAALQAYQNALSAISTRRAGTLQNFGMTAKVDANGNLTNYGIDPNNQYGQIQQLLGNEGSQIDALRHSAMDRGLGAHGLGAQGVARARLAGGLAQQNLGRQFVGEIGQEAADQYQAGSAYQSAKLQAQRDAISQAIMNNWFTPALQSSAGTQPAPLTTGTTQNTTNTTVANKTQPTKYQRTTLARNMGVGI